MCGSWCGQTDDEQEKLLHGVLIGKLVLFLWSLVYDRRQRLPTDCRQWRGGARHECAAFMGIAVCDFSLCGLRGVKVTGAREMKNFLSENLGTIVVLMMVIAAVAAVVWNMSRRKRSGKSGCECMDCPSREICRSNK